MSNNFNTSSKESFKEIYQFVEDNKPYSDAWFAWITPILNKIKTNRLSGKDTVITIHDEPVLTFHADGSITNHRRNSTIY